MTFEQWWHVNMPELVSGEEADDRAIAQASWTAATNFERNRCAIVCEAHATNVMKPNSGTAWSACHECADAIRAT